MVYTKNINPMTIDITKANIINFSFCISSIIFMRFVIIKTSIKYIKFHMV